MRVTHVTAEASPYAKVGGLGDVCGALPPALRKHGIEARVMLPAYRHLRDLPYDALEPVRVGEWEFGVRALHGKPVYLLDCPAFFDRPDIYVDNRGEGFPDNPLRFSAFALAAGEVARRIGTDVLHLHDWQSAIAATLPIPSVLTLHNLAHQGHCRRDVLDRLGVPLGTFECYDGANLLQGGICHAGVVTTVSPTHAAEIITPQGGFGLAPVLQRVGPLGILNGLDQDEWNPATQPALMFPFNASNLAPKRANKHAFLNTLGFSPKRWHLPLVVVLSRIVQQKGIGLLADALPKVLAKRSCNVVIMGKGEHELVERLQALQDKMPLSVRLLDVFDQPTAHRLVAAGDFIVIPSLFEPCGLTQMQAQRYGTLPIVRRTGGLADTVVDASSPNGTGFIFDLATSDALADSIFRALNTFALDPLQVTTMRARAMGVDFSWDARAREYEAVYKRVTAMHEPHDAHLFAVAPQSTRAYYHFRGNGNGTLALYDETLGYEVARAGANGPSGDGWFSVTPGHRYRLRRFGDTGIDDTRFAAPQELGASARGS